MMKRIVQSAYLSLLIFFFLLPSNITCLEGFATGTLVGTAQGMTPIEEITPRTPVVPYYVSDEVVEVCRYTGHHFVRITIKDTVIDAAHNQRFYSVTRREWIKAEDLAPCEKLLCADRSAVMIDDVEEVCAPVILHSLSTKRAHIYFVSPYKILVHNAEPGLIATSFRSMDRLMGSNAFAGAAGGVCVVETFVDVAIGGLSVACPAAAPILGIGKKIITWGIFGGLLLYQQYSAYKERKAERKRLEEEKNAIPVHKEEYSNIPQLNIVSTVNNTTNNANTAVVKQADDRNKKGKKFPPPLPGSDQKKKHENDENDKYPFGKTHDVPYHHKNSRGGADGGKGRPPQDSQHCLDNSLPYIGNQRIAIEEDKFFVLKKTAHRLYHAHEIPWDKIEKWMQHILKKKGYVTASGRVINQIIEKTHL